jgi:hypothetical protein
MGDPGFLAHGRIDPSTADAPRATLSVPLGVPTIELAAALGYDLATGDAQDRRSRRDSLTRQRELRLAGRQRDVA